MARLQTALLSSRVIIEEGTGNITIVDLIDAIELKRTTGGGERVVAGVKRFQSHAFFVCVWARTSDDESGFKFRVRVRSPSGKKRTIAELDASFEDRMFMRSLIQLRGLPNDVLGMFSFLVELATANGNKFRKVGEVAYLVKPVTVES